MYINLPTRTHLFRFRNGMAISQLILPGHEDGFSSDREAYDCVERALKRGMIIPDLNSVSPADIYQVGDSPISLGKDSHVGSHP